MDRDKIFHRFDHGPELSYGQKDFTKDKDLLSLRGMLLKKRFLNGVFYVPDFSHVGYESDPIMVDFTDDITHKILNQRIDEQLLYKIFMNGYKGERRDQEGVINRKSSFTPNAKLTALLEDHYDTSMKLMTAGKENTISFVQVNKMWPTLFGAKFNNQMLFYEHDLK